MMNTPPSKLAILVASALLLSAGRVMAGETPKFTLAGFGTLGLAHSTQRQADYTTQPWYNPHGAGYSQNWSADVDSRVGLQFDAQFNPRLSAVLQVVSELRYDNTYTPSIEWANVKYAFTPDASVRFGRIVMATFLASDYRKIGYAYPWLRPPLEVYNMMPVDYNDGMDATYRFHFGEASNTVNAFYGADNLKSPASGYYPWVANNAARGSWGIFDTFESGPVTLRLSYEQTTLTLDGVNSFFEQFRNFGAQGQALYAQYNAYRVPTIFWGMSAKYDPGKWFVMGEAGKSRLMPSFMGKQFAWYVSGGYRVRQFTPYAIYAKSKKLSTTSDPGLNLASVPPFMQAYAAGLNAGLNNFLAPPTSATTSLGVRWDFMKNVDLKLQYDHTRLDAGSSGLLINLQPGFVRGSGFNLYSAVVDWVF